MRKKNTSNQQNSKLKQRWARFCGWRHQVQERQRVGRVITDIAPKEYEECVCLNCGYTFRGHYCPNCGQSADTQRITMKSALNNLFTTLIGGDSVFLRTCGNLLYRPGYMIREFICGKRTRYFRPVQMLLCLVTVYALFSLVFKDSSTVNELSSELGKTSNETLYKASQILIKFLSNTVAYSLVFAFINVFPLKLMFHRCTMAWPDGERRSLNTAEYFFTLVYLSCLLIIIDFVMMPIGWIPGTNEILNTIALLLAIFFPVWTCKQMFEISWWKSFWKNIIASSITIAFVIILLILYYGIYYGVAAVIK